MAKEKKKKKKISVVLIIIIIGCLAVIAFAAYNLISQGLLYREGQKEYEALQQYTLKKTIGDVEDQETDQTEENNGSITKKQKALVPAPITVDHASLMAINSDYVGWLYMESADINYPIVKRDVNKPDEKSYTDSKAYENALEQAYMEANNYYLHRSIEQNDLYAGTLFVDSMNSRDFSDPNTIVYGHNMQDQSMFGRLKLIQEQGWYADDPYFWILTPEKDLRYQIISMHTTADDGETYTIFGGPCEDVKTYIDKMCALSAVELEVPEYDEDSKIVTLSTCVGNDNQRFVVQGLLIQES